MMTDILIRGIVILVQAAGVVLAVDFVSGVLHWLEDSYGRASWPLVGKRVIAPNIKHHFRPRAFTKSTFLRRNTVTLLLAGLRLGVVTLFGWLNWMWVLACVVGGIANEIHCWAHRSPRENGKFITFLHRWKILQSPKGHAVHHTDPKDCSYCTVTDWLNPILDRLRFWERCEWMIRKVTGARRREDESVRRPKVPICRCAVGEACVNCPRRQEMKKAA